VKVHEIIRRIESDGWSNSEAGTLHNILVVIERAGTHFSAYSPDLPGCVATGDTRKEVEANMYQALEMHIEGLKEDGLPIPDSDSFAEYVLVKAS
jgi:predicted RNase H-like HicB family nuclease